MISCPFCGSACNEGAIICPFCKVELPPKNLINSYRRILERDRSFLEPGNRKKLDLQAQKDFDARQVAMAEARHADAVAETRRREQEQRESEARAEESRRKQEELNAKIAAFFKKYGWAIGSLAAGAMILNFVIVPLIQEKRLEAKYRESTAAACSYAIEVDESMSGLYERLAGQLKAGKKFGTYWVNEVNRVTTIHIEKIRKDFINPSALSTVVSKEVSDYEYAISYDLSRLRGTFSTYWDSQDFQYYGRDRILEENDNFIAWCEEPKA